VERVENASNVSDETMDYDYESENAEVSACDRLQSAAKREFPASNSPTNSAHRPAPPHRYEREQEPQRRTLVGEYDADDDDTPSAGGIGFGDEIDDDELDDDEIDDEVDNIGNYQQHQQHQLQQHQLQQLRQMKQNNDYLLISRSPPEPNYDAYNDYDGDEEPIEFYNIEEVPHTSRPTCHMPPAPSPAPPANEKVQQKIMEDIQRIDQENSSSSHEPAAAPPVATPAPPATSKVVVKAKKTETKTPGSKVPTKVTIKAIPATPTAPAAATKIRPKIKI